MLKNVSDIQHNFEIQCLLFLYSCKMVLDECNECFNKERANLNDNSHTTVLCGSLKSSNVSNVIRSLFSHKFIF